MNEELKIKYGLLKDELKADLGAFDMFDKVINLRFIAGEVTLDEANNQYVVPDFSGVYVLRSDYEPVFFDTTINDKGFRDTNGKRYYIRKCMYKPSIKVDYKIVANKTEVELDIYIDNFYMLSTDGTKLTTFSSESNPIRFVQVQMGYFGQFTSVPHETMTDLFKFSSGSGIDIITGHVKAVYNDKAPPDSRMHIKCVVGTSMLLNTDNANIELEEPDFASELNNRSVKKLSYDTVKKNTVALRNSEYVGLGLPVDTPSGRLLNAPGTYMSGKAIDKALASLNADAEAKAEAEDISLADQCVVHDVAVAPPTYDMTRYALHALGINSYSAGADTTANDSKMKDAGFNYHNASFDKIVDEDEETAKSTVGQIVQCQGWKYISSSDLIDISFNIAEGEASKTLKWDGTKSFIKWLIDAKNSVVDAYKSSIDYVKNNSALNVLKAHAVLGTKIVLSDGVKKLSYQILDSEGSPVDKTLIATDGDYNSALERDLNKCFMTFGENVRYTYSNRGYIFVYTDNEAQDLAALAQFFNSTEKGGNAINSSEYVKMFGNKIPAVYNINFDALCTVNCPFFSFINPFQQLLFTNRYVTGSLIQYYTNENVSSLALYAIQCSVSFATVENDNEMQIRCVKSPSTDAKMSDEAKSVDDYVRKLEEEADE